METKDKRVKREIANSNERRRMQSINAGFQKLKRLLPVNDGEKLSKASILQHASEFIQQIEHEKSLLHDQNTLLRRTLIDIKAGTAAPDSIDLDSLPIIPINTRIAIKPETRSSNNANSSSTDNSNDDCSKEAHSNNNNKNNSNNNNGSITRITINKNGNNNIEVNNSKIIICSNNNDNNDYHELAQLPVASVTEIISDRVTSPNGLVSTGVAKAAIALPLEVPYTSETAIIHHDLHPPPTKMVKLEPIIPIPIPTTTITNSNTTTTTTTTVDSQDTPPKGQNLDTICKAIIQIEGDRIFTNENIKHETT